MPVGVKYSTVATSTGGRDGSAKSQDGRFEAKLSTPKELGGAGGVGTNPEQLFGAGYPACFIGALQLAGQQLKVQVPDDTTVTATVGIGPYQKKNDRFPSDQVFAGTVPNSGSEYSLGKSSATARWQSFFSDEAPILIGTLNALNS